MTIEPQLQELIEVFNNSDIKYWLDSGALLGIIREGRIMSGDDIICKYLNTLNI